MKSETFLRAMNDLPEDLIAEGNLKRRHPLIRIAAVAACLLVLISGMYPFFRSQIQGLGASDGSLELITFNGAMYEIWYAGGTQPQRMGLPDRIDDTMVGLQVETLEGTGTVHLYLPIEDQRAVYILREEDGTLQYLLFAGYVIPGDNGNAHVEADQMFITYGITDVSGLRSVTWEDQTVTDADTLSAFYDALVSAPAYGELDYRELLDDGAGAEVVWLEAENGLKWMAYYSTTTGVFSWCYNYYTPEDIPILPASSTK